ncbi:MAG: DUF58 domain-containing protein [Methanospirillaceae archaeon]|nr:DUF58 domain-containing protein [Methanospirillaceae archaeon]
MNNEKLDELIRLVRVIDMRTRFPVQGQVAGIHHSLYKGQGIEFSDIREYIPGDDIRSIDWKVTARYGKPYVKEFTEERDQTHYFVVDLSGSGLFGDMISKQRLILEIIATLLFSALRDNDRCGLVIVTDSVEVSIPARPGRKHITHLLTTLLSHKPVSKGSDMRPALVYLAQKLRRSCSVILLSDFIVPDFTRELRQVRRHHDVIAIRVADSHEIRLPDVGLIELEDAETGEQILVDTGDPSFQKNYTAAVQEAEDEIQSRFMRHNVPYCTIMTHETCHVSLARFFLHKKIAGRI